jgi:glycine cleavage system H protein
MEIPNDLRYTLEHEWIRTEGNKGTIGITAFAQDQLGDIVFVDLPQVGTQIVKEETFGVVESVKTVSDLYAPVSGTVVAVNKILEATPELINSEPYGNGWLIEIEVSNQQELDKLPTPEQYSEQCEKETE